MASEEVVLRLLCDNDNNIDSVHWYSSDWRTKKTEVSQDAELNCSSELSISLPKESFLLTSFFFSVLICPLHCTFALSIFFRQFLNLKPHFLFSWTIIFFKVKFYLFDHIFLISLFISPSKLLLFFLGLFLPATKRHKHVT